MKFPIATFAGMLLAASGASAVAAPPATTVEYQVMVSTGLAAGQPFEAWFVFDKPADPRVPGYAVPPGAAIRFTFPEAFTPKPGFLGVVMLTGWAQGSIPAKFSFAVDNDDPRTVVVRFDGGIEAGPPEQPGLKAIHLRTSLVNPPAGTYPEFTPFANVMRSGTTPSWSNANHSPVRPNPAMTSSRIRSTP